MIPELSIFEIALRLFIAVLLGGLIGFEREISNRPAGFRTHILVCVGSALIMMVSVYGFYCPGVENILLRQDPGRMAAGVVTGIGFLGAGTIIQHRGNIKGLTTAAGIWVVSGIGLAVGVGYWKAAMVATFFVLLSLYVLNKVDNVYLSRHKYKILSIKAIDQIALLSKISGVLGEHHMNIKKINISQAEFVKTYNSEVIMIDFTLEAPVYIDYQEFYRRLVAINGVLEISWQGEDVFVSSSSSSSSLFS
ncbi:MAG: MgtC/SapB family protein [Firmicutes bacterium]|nr:MgtC/SapB family protein [Bacillota bacterium]